MTSARLRAARCPGALHAVDARDGPLVRVRIPGGLLSTAQMRALAHAAERCGDGRLDVTARASVQLRAIERASLDELASLLLAAELVPSAEHDRVRNIAASPFAGVDPGELVDVRPIVRALDARLVADAALAALPPKFAFAVDGGGRPFDLSSAEIPALRAKVAPASAVGFHVTLGRRPTGLGVPGSDAVDAMLAAARAAQAFARTRGASDREWRLAKMPEADVAIVAALGKIACARSLSATSIAST